MARVNKAGALRPKVTATSPVKAVADPSLRTYEGGAGYRREEKGELLALGTSMFDGEDTFYESAQNRQERWERLCASVAVADPAWFLQFVTWLRSDGNIRTASLRAAVAGVHARMADDASQKADASAHGHALPAGLNRAIISAVCQRADEPGELLAIWHQSHGRRLPWPVKRGIADAADRLYNEYGYLEYDKPADAIRMADVLELCHPRGRAPWQGALYRHVINARHDHASGADLLEFLPKITAYSIVTRTAQESPRILADPAILRNAGMSWKKALSMAGTRVPKKDLWEALIPSMGYMALIRNLRNFDEAGISDEAAQAVTARISDPASVARSRQFPFRFLTAYQNAPSLRWGWPLEQAFQHSVAGIPELPGRTLILVDTSNSMTTRRLSQKSEMSVADAAALFGVALLQRNPGAELWGFADGVFRHQMRPGASVLREVSAFRGRTGEAGHGTQTVNSLRMTYHGHDRVIIITDMQAFRDYGRSGYYLTETRQTVTDIVPPAAFLYGFSLGGYAASMMPSGTGTRHELTGLTDATFRMIPLLERDSNAPWPWEESA